MVSRAVSRGLIALALAAVFAIASPAAFAHSAPFYGQHLSGEFGVFNQAGERVCTVELTSRYNQVRETFGLNARDCPEPFASALRWELESGMDSGPHQIAFWAGGFTPVWRGTVPAPGAQVWTGEASTGEAFELRPESAGPLSWLRGEPQARRQADVQARRLQPGDLLGVYQVSSLNESPRECFLTLFRGPNGGGRISVRGVACGPFDRADRFRFQSNALLVRDIRGEPVWSGSIRQPEGGVRIVGGDRQVGQWELNRLGANLPPSGAGLDMATLAGQWRFEELGGPSCPLTLGVDGRVMAARGCEEPGELFERWRLEGDMLILSDAWRTNPTDLWRGRVVDLDSVEGRGADALVGMPPRRIGRSRLVR